MKTKLIILEQGNIIVSDEEIKEGDWYFLNTTGMKIASPTGVYRQSGKEVTCKLNNLSCNIQKVIASDNPEHNLPKVDYSHPIEKDGVIKTIGECLSIIDVEKLARSYAKIHPTKDIDEEERYFNSNCKYYDAFKEGFKKAQSLNDKKFSLEDIFKILDLHTDDAPISYLKSELSKSLQQPKVFDVEIKMERTRYPKDDDGWEDIYNPKITNNSIKITKVL